MSHPELDHKPIETGERRYFASVNQTLPNLMRNELESKDFADILHKTEDGLEQLAISLSEIYYLLTAVKELNLN